MEHICNETENAEFCFGHYICNLYFPTRLIKKIQQKIILKQIIIQVLTQIHAHDMLNLKVL